MFCRPDLTHHFRLLKTAAAIPMAAAAAATGGAASAAGATQDVATTPARSLQGSSITAFAQAPAKRRNGRLSWHFLDRMGLAYREHLTGRAVNNVQTPTGTFTRRGVGIEISSRFSLALHPICPR
jgi:hypothetical protein